MKIKTDMEITIGDRKLKELQETGYIYNKGIKIVYNRREFKDRDAQFTINNNNKILITNEDLAELDKQPVTKFGYELILTKPRTKKPEKVSKPKK